MQPAKKTYESLLKDAANTTALSHIQVFKLELPVEKYLDYLVSSEVVMFDVQFIRFLRRTEGVEAARRYFLAVRNSPSCTYQVYVAYAMVAFCLDKDAKVS